MPKRGDDQEHERRFLIRDSSILHKCTLMEGIEQYYLWEYAGYSVRVRVSTLSEGDVVAMLTLKGPRDKSSRYEVETEIDPVEAAKIAAGAISFVSKSRFGLISEGRTWIIDQFHGANEGLLVAEYEGSAGEVNQIRRPQWAEREITGDPRFDNESLAEGMPS